MFDEVDFTNKYIEKEIVNFVCVYVERKIVFLCLSNNYKSYIEIAIYR